jgi:hypothetical protein
MSRDLESAAPGLVRTWARDLALGARLSTGGREGLIRTVLTALGVALGVAVLLFAASVPSMVSNHDLRAAARAYSSQNVPVAADTALVTANGDTTYYDLNVYGLLMKADGDKPPLPPGVSTFPAPGDMVVSPALAALLASPHGALLKERLDFRTIGVITQAGLTGPGELAYYAGSDQATLSNGAVRINGFGQPEVSSPLDSVLSVLILVGVMLLLAPIALLVATSARFGGERRDRRLAALRLVGVDSRAVRRIAAGETLCGALAGLALGSGLFLLLRQLIAHVSLIGFNVFPSDVAPSIGIVALIVLAVPASTVAAALLALRGVAIEPLGVVRNARPRRRRLWWRLVLPLLGLGLLIPLAGTLNDNVTTEARYQICVGAALLLIGITALLPWLVELVVTRFGDGPVPWQLAARRLQLNSVSAARMVSGIMVAVAGAITLQMLFSGVQSSYVSGASPAASQAPVQVDYSYPSYANPAQVADATSRYRATPGVTAVTGLITAMATSPKGQADSDSGVSVTVGDCATLAALADIGSCVNGDVYLVSYDLNRVAAAIDPDSPGTRLDLDNGVGPGTNSGTDSAAGSGLGSVGRYWTVPAGARTVEQRYVPGYGSAGVLATPGALDPGRLQEPVAVDLVTLDPQRADAMDQLRNTAFHVSPGVLVFNPLGPTVDHSYSQIVRGVEAGAIVILLLIGASLLLSVLEQLRERKELLAVLVAFGTRRSTLAQSVLYQTAIPVALGLALATLGGLGLGAMLLRMLSRPIAVDWAGVAAVIGVGAAMVMVVTLLSLPPLWRMMRPDGLRTE